MTLKTSTYLLFVPVFLFFAVLACTGQLANMVINAPPAFVCPTPLPIPTDVMPPPDTVGPGTPIPTPRPIYTPYPTVRPYVITPPDDFYVGDPVDAGNVRFVLRDVATVSASPTDDGSARRRGMRIGSSRGR